LIVIIVVFVYVICDL